VSVPIRPAGPSDAAVVAAMVREIAEHEDQSAHVHVDESLWRSLLARPAIRRLHLWTGGDVLALDDLFVRPGHRSGGVGRRLMTALAAVAAPERLLITWGVEPDNVDAQRFYRRLGATLRTKVIASWSPEAYLRA
jgi:GNAT superfamily N-acetyltransferase